MEAASPIGQQVRDWRVGANMSGAALALALGISRGKVSELEKGTFLPGVRVALRLEELSGGMIDAAALNEDVAAARARPGWALSEAEIDGLDPAGEAAPAETRVIICDVCERRVDGGIPNACTFVDCPHSGHPMLGEAA